MSAFTQILSSCASPQETRETAGSWRVSGAVASRSARHNAWCVGVWIVVAQPVPQEHAEAICTGEEVFLS